MGFFDKIKEGLAKTRKALSNTLDEVFENAEKIAVSVGEAYNFLYEENSAYDSISMAASSLEKLSGIDSRIDEVASKITDKKLVFPLAFSLQVW